MDRWNTRKRPFEGRRPESNGHDINTSCPYTGVACVPFALSIPVMQVFLRNHSILELEEPQTFCCPALLALELKLRHRGEKNDALILA